MAIYNNNRGYSNRGSGRSARGRGGSNFKRGRGRGSFRGRNNRRNFDENAPKIQLGTVVHDCEGSLVCKLTNEKVPYFNAPVYMDKKSLVGKVDDVFGTTKNCLFSVTLSDGIKSESLMKRENLEIYVPVNKLLPKSIFLSDK
ncbi:H/ACA snoRNP pseudouridylase subunit [Bonamia ostreae]|uniref:H/ACA ribonucleoprotein complex subunit n=1 Tax=Bonamia ostreae TaxID=126728 RepID=A0ABV2AIW9_9EUKA